MKTFSKLFLFPFLAFTLLFSACKNDKFYPGLSKSFNGTNQTLGNGTIHSFIVLAADGKPQTIGLRFSESGLTGLTSDSSGASTVLDLPSQAKITGFDHLEVDWNPYGHAPTAIYGLPHFDFHFYRVTPAEQASVIPGPDTVTVPKNFVPQDYFSGISAVPNMGVHWIDSKAAELNGQKFTDTFIYGFYHGKLTFLEPMVTTAFLSTKTDFKVAIKQPIAFAKSGYYPTVQHVYFNNASKEYIIALEGLVYH